jgi:16S rRNA (cytosine967-C5)-methyltransferase
MSVGINKTQLIESHLQQPDVFLRVLRGAADRVASEFLKLGLSHSKTDLINCWRVKTGSHLQETSSWKNGLFEIQDYNSQQICHKVPVKPNEFWWDACSGAGGKTLFMVDHFPSIHFLCSDIRERILEQLKLRLKRNHVKVVTTEVMDASSNLPQGKIFDGVLVDAPCSGSGTWTRNPENLVFFDEHELTNFASRQLNILQNTSKALKSGGYLVYITCSIFAIENEEVAASFMLNKGYDLVVQEMLPGYLNASDSLFIAVLKKN